MLPPWSPGGTEGTASRVVGRDAHDAEEGIERKLQSAFVYSDPSAGGAVDLVGFTEVAQRPVIRGVFTRQCTEAVTHADEAVGRSLFEVHHVDPEHVPGVRLADGDGTRHHMGSVVDVMSRTAAGNVDGVS